ncbi:secretin N-terminal domain-containing protein [Thermostilla marina]
MGFGIAWTGMLSCCSVAQPPQHEEAARGAAVADAAAEKKADGIPIDSISEEDRKKMMGLAEKLSPDDRRRLMEAVKAGRIPFDLAGKLKELGEKAKDESDTGEKDSSNDEEHKGDEKPDDEDAPKVIERPTEPPSPPDPKELEVRPDEEGRVRFNFHHQPWEGVLQWLADISQMSLDWQELPADYLNLSTQLSYTVPEARDLINRHLFARGFTMIEQGEVLSVVNLEKLDPGVVPRVSPTELDSLPDYAFVRTSFGLDWLIADQVAEELKPLLSPHGKLIPLSATNRLEAMDVVVNLREIRRLLDEEQSRDDDQGRLVREFVLKYARAEEVVEQLKTLIGQSNDNSGMRMPGMSPDMMRRMQEQAMQMMAKMAASQGRGGPAKPQRNDEANFVVNTRRNSILVNAPPDKMAIIEEAVKAIDVPSGSAESPLVTMNRWQVYRLAAVDPEPLVETLRELGGLEPTTRLEIDRENNAIIAYASLADHAVIKALIDRLDGSGRRFEVIQLRELPADYVAGTINFMMTGKEEENRSSYNWWNPWERYRRPEGGDGNKFRVDADVENNRLLLWANDIEIEEVRKLLVKLGEIPEEANGPSRVRIVEFASPEEADRLLEMLERQWPDLSPHPLEIERAPLPDEENLDEPPQAESHDEAAKKEETDTASTARESTVRLDADRPSRFHFAADTASVQDQASDTAPDAAPADTESIPESSPEKAIEEVNDTTSIAGTAAMSSSSPVRVYRGPDGKLVISSNDPAAVAQVEQLLSSMKSKQPDYRIFRLQYAWAGTVADILRDVFSEEERSSPFFWRPSREEGTARLSQRKPVEFLADNDTNTILVKNATEQQLREIRELIEYYDQPPPTDSQSVRITKVFKIEYGDADEIGDAIKDVFRDLLSTNDRAFGGGRNQPDPFFSMLFGLDDRMPRFKGLLSLGVDEESNSLIVSAPSFLMEDIEKMIEELDRAAEPLAPTVEVIQLGDSVSAENVRRSLGRILGTSGGSSSGRYGSSGSSYGSSRYGSSSSRYGGSSHYSRDSGHR